MRYSEAGQRLDTYPGLALALCAPRLPLRFAPHAAAATAAADCIEGWQLIKKLNSHAFNFSQSN